MSHDKIKAAARRRMAETGESYAAARRAVNREQQEQAASMSPAAGARWFAISYSDAWEGRVSAWLDARLFGAGRGVSGVEVDTGEIRVRMGSFKLDIPRASVRSVERSHASAPPTRCRESSIRSSPTCDSRMGAQLCEAAPR